MVRFLTCLAVMTVCAAGAACGGKEATIPAELSAEEERRYEEELKATRAEEAKQPREMEKDDEP